MSTELKLYTIQLDNLEQFEDYLIWSDICITTSKEKALDIFLNIYKERLSKAKQRFFNLQLKQVYSISNERQIKEIENNIQNINMNNICEYTIEEKYYGVL